MGGNENSIHYKYWIISKRWEINSLKGMQIWLSPVCEANIGKKERNFNKSGEFAKN